MELPNALILLVSLYTISVMHPSILLTVSGSNSTDDQLALLSFKSLLSDPTAALSSWGNKTLNPCTWRGVTCGRTKRVTTLNLASLNLTGPISPSLSNLTSLTRLYLGGNRLNGQIPQELGRLHRLRYLNLSYNALEGEIPVTLSNCLKLIDITLNRNFLHGEIPSSLSRCSNLSAICLDRNMLTGVIPDSFASLTKLWKLSLGKNNLTGDVPSWLGRSGSLQRIDLSSNGLTGPIPPSLGNLSLVLLDLSANNLVGGIPPSIGNCSDLVDLDLSENGLEGNIPDSFSYFPRLTTFDISFNELTGPVPFHVYNLSSLEFLSLGMNQLIGTLPPGIGQTLPSLQALILQGNQFEGPVPLSFTNASGIGVLDLSQNRFTGLVPPNLGELPYLYHLNLEWNLLEAKDAKGWRFLTSLTNCTELVFLILSYNTFQGDLPIQVGNLSAQLEWLMLGGNQITGRIPAEIGNLVSLTTLNLSNNLLTGTVPAAIGRLQALQVLNLSGNRLSGNIPSLLGNLTQLNELQLGENDLQGNIPTSFENFINLGVLNLSHNQLVGAIPKEVVSISALSQVLDLSHNSLSGFIPVEVGRLANLASLDVSYNRLSGEIPSSLGDCVVLQYLFMGQNLLIGPIPSHLSNLKGIQELDLSHNNLSGNIPKFLATFSTLHYLNLSFNDFEGEVPMAGIFTNVTAFSINGNGKLCGGESGDTKLQLPICSIQESKKMDKFPTLKVVIPIVSLVMFLILLFCLGILYRKRKPRKISSSMSFSASGDKYTKVSYNELRKATNGFSTERIIGVGSFGCVYKGRIASYKKDIAVKVLNLQQRGALKCFEAECEVLRSIRHRNLVKILTSCSTIDAEGNDFRALVFDFMPNGNLDEWLHPGVSENQKFSHLSLVERLNIAIDVAFALEYLHHNGETPIVHCDLKPGNVLLNGDMNAHVSDFGLARFNNGKICISTEDPTYSTAIKGSIGYVAPEYGMGDQVSTHGDVYSYGILLLEMLIGKRPTDDMFAEGLILPKYVEMAFPERVMEIVDPQILSREPDKEGTDSNPNESELRGRMQECLVSMIKVGILCSRETPTARMDMRNVVVEMVAVRTSYLGLGEPKWMNLLPS